MPHPTADKSFDLRHAWTLGGVETDHAFTDLVRDRKGTVRITVDPVSESAGMGLVTGPGFRRR
ncbi:hypothetical protein [Arthrobacter methylotrophus]|uniref:hypothetical protein n=1 Tax=Arthrobacter methylotrophus TaxID=121291 RepID=UPI000488EC66